MKFQGPSQLVNVSGWRADDQFNPYPQGARDKSAVECPDPAPSSFLLPGYRYLFKLSNHNYPAQFWAEIVAYKVGCLTCVPVPPAFAAIKGNQTAVLIEWFYEWGATNVSYVSGGDYMIMLNKNYDRRKGTQHGLDAILNVGKVLKVGQEFESDRMIEDIVKHWGKVFTFDAIIGNQDRHQDNWGVIWHVSCDGEITATFSPAFDNGTSLGHEIIENNLSRFDDANRLSSYISRGRHHPKWSWRDTERMGHAEFILKYVEEYPEAYPEIAACLDLDFRELREQIMGLCGFECSTPFTKERAEFVIRLLSARVDNLRRMLRA